MSSVVYDTATRKDIPLKRTVIQLFEEQVARNPNAIAAVCEGEQFSYRQLNEQTNQLAHLLCEQGIGPETLVALLAERGLPFLLWILAVFKAGGAYLPLDPRHPEARLRRVLEQSDCRLVLSSADFIEKITSATQDLPEESRPVCLTFEELALDSRSKENPTVETLPNSLMYVIYTSGSTGQPKGAMVEQQGMLNHLYAKIEALSLSSADTVAQTASQCFDISVWQLLAALLVGGRVQIYPDAIAHDPLSLLEHVEEQKVSILETVPSLLRAMLELSKRPPLQALRWMIPTGEALPVDLSRRWLQCYPHIPLLNAYGPTECSDDVTHYVISEPPAATCRSIPIGKAIPNLQLYVLDGSLNPVPVGVSGELYVGGVGVGRGYRNDPRRTAEAFVADPFSQEPGARLYKTGDLGRYLLDGNLEFLGRVDFQVKLRGHRIELGEIEAALHQHPAVREAVALVREDVPGEQRLVAYVVPREGNQVSSEELKAALTQQVPSSMVPSAFVMLERMPLSSNGKLDRAGLPVPEWSRGEQEEAYVAPVSPLERQLVKLWEEVLGAPQVGIRDDFFALGGDSLQAVRLFTRIEQECGKRLPLSTLFAGATIEQMAQMLLNAAQSETARTRAPLVTVQEGGSRRPFFFLHGQWEGGALYSLELARALGPEQPFYLLEPYEFEGLAVPPSLEEMAAAHLETLRTVQPEGPYLLGGWCNGGLIAYEMARQLHAQGQTVELLVLMDSDVPAPRFKWDRRIVTGLSRLFLLGQKREVDLFLLYRYLRLSYYYWRLRLVKFLKNDRHGVTGSASSLTNALFPKSEVLRQDWLSIYDWIAAGYMPHSYDGQITFFWTEEEPLRRRGWIRLIEGKEVDIHTIPGNHMTSRTQFLPILAEHLRSCLDNVL
jgi:amino acid adenylation domain-containing protein